MEKLRKYGAPPFQVAVVHGGPGGPGQVAPVARELSKFCGVIEPLQTKDNIAGQIEELKSVLEKHAEIPSVVIGHSWGAMLGFLLAARYPELIRKLILIASPLFESKYAEQIMNTRLQRLNKEDRERIEQCLKQLNDSEAVDKNKVFKELALLAIKTDSYQPIPYQDETMEFQYDIFSKVWREAEELRASGEFARSAKNIKIPVVAIHGEHDPISFAWVKEFLSPLLKDFQFQLLQKCGHYPWVEQFAWEEFYRLLKREI